MIGNPERDKHILSRHHRSLHPRSQASNNPSNKQLRLRRRRSLNNRPNNNQDHGAEDQLASPNVLGNERIDYISTTTTISISDQIHISNAHLLRERGLGLQLTTTPRNTPKHITAHNNPHAQRVRVVKLILPVLVLQDSAEDALIVAKEHKGEETGCRNRDLEASAAAHPPCERHDAEVLGFAGDGIVDDEVVGFE